MQAASGRNTAQASTTQRSGSKVALDSLVSAARVGDPEAWEEIVLRLRADLVRFARSRGVTDPDDLAQDVMVAAVCHIGRIDGGWDGLRAWMFTVASRRCADFHRRRHRRLEISVEEPPDHPSGPADRVIWEAAASREVAEALSILTERERRVVTLRIIHEIDTKTVASMLGLSVANVRVIQSRALRRLRRYLENAGGHLDKRFRGSALPSAVLSDALHIRLTMPSGVPSGGSPMARIAPASSAVAETTASWPWTASAMLQAVAAALVVVGVGVAPLLVADRPASASVSDSAASADFPAPTNVAEPHPESSSSQDAPTTVEVPQEGLHGAVAGAPSLPTPDDDTITRVPTPPTSDGFDDPAAVSEGVGPAPTEQILSSSGVPTSTTEAIGSTVDAAASAVDDTTGAVTEVADSVASAAAGAVDAVTDAADEVTSGATSEVTEVVDRTTSDLSDGVDEVTDGVEDAVSETTHTASTSMEGVNETVETVEEVVGETADPLDDLVGGLLGE